MFTGRPALPTDAAIAMIAKIGQGRARRLVFGGGDPFLRRDLRTLVWYAVSVGLEVEVQTNGENPYNLCMADLSSSVKTWGLSVDSAEMAVHDTVREKRGNYSKVWDLARSFVNLGLEWNLRTVVCKPTLQTFGRIGDNLREIGFTGKWYLLQYSPVGDQAHNRELFDISQHEFDAFTDFVRERYRGASFDTIPVPDADRRSIYFLIAPDGAVYNHPPPGLPYSVVGSLISDEFSTLVDRLRIDYSKHYGRYGHPVRLGRDARPTGTVAQRLFSIESSPKVQ